MLSKKTLFIFLLAFVLCFSIAGGVLAEDYGLGKTAETAHLTQYGSDLPAIIGKVIGTVLSLIGVIFFALMIYGGFLWMTAHGKEEQAKQGLNTVIAAVIGLIVILAAYAISNFVFSSVK